MKVPGDINVRVKGGKVGSLESTEGSVSIVMSDADDKADDVGTSSWNLNDYLKSWMFPNTNSSKAPSLKERVQTEYPPQAKIDAVIGMIIRCTQCGVSSKEMYGMQKTGPSSNTPDGLTFTDLANQVHRISENGVYQIINKGEGRYEVKRLSDHAHF